MSVLIAKRFAVSKQVHVQALQDAIRPLMWGRSTHVTDDGDGVILECADWTAVDLQAIQAQIDAAPEDTEKQRAKYEMDKDQVPLLWRAILRVLVKYDNGALTAGSLAKFKADVLAELEVIG